MDRTGRCLHVNPHPEQQLEPVLDEFSAKELQVISLDPGSTDLFVQESAARADDGTEIIYCTQSIDFFCAEQMI